MARQIEGFVADDGTFFETEREANVYEARKEMDELSYSCHWAEPENVVLAARLVRCLIIVHGMPISYSTWQMDPWLEEQVAKLPKAATDDDIPF